MPPFRARPLPLLALIPLLLSPACRKTEDDTSAPTTPTSPEATQSVASVMLRGDYEAPDGAMLKVTETLSIEDASILQRIGENEISGRMSVVQTERQSIRFLRDGTREIEIGEGGSTLTTQFGEGDPVEEIQDDKLTGKTLVGKLRPDGQWAYSVKGIATASVPEGFAAANLRSNDLYPTEWKDFGEVWSPEPEALGALLGRGFQLTEGKIEMRALGYAKRAGQPCAEVAANITAKGLFRSGASRQDISLKMKGKFYRSLHVYHDLEANLTGTIEMYERRGNADVRIEGPVTFKREATWDENPEESPAS